MNFQVDVEKAKAAFASYDIDGDGMISIDEYLIGCRANSNIERDDDIAKMFRIFDVNKDGALELDEFIESLKFCGISKEIVELNVLEIRDAFNVFDANGDGKITLQEYIDGSRKIGNNSSEEALAKAFKLFDYDKDGEITYKEFTWALHYLAATCYDRDANLNADFTLNVRRK